MRAQLAIGVVVLGLILGGVGVSTRVQSTRVTSGGTLPSVCQIGDVYVKTGGSPGLYYCEAANTWHAPASPGGLPSGALVLMSSGTCPAGTTEATDLDGKMLAVTTVAHVNVGTTGGSDDITPAGSVTAPTFTGTGSQVTSATSGGTPAGTNGTAAFTPAGTNGTAAFTPAGTNGTVSFTPAGTNGTVSFTPAGTNQALTFTGSAFSSVINHTHTVTITDPGHTHVENANNVITGGLTGWAAAPDTSTNTATAMGFSTASATTGITAADSNPAGGVASITPAGTINTPTFTGSSGTVPAQTFTGSSGTVPAQTFTGSAGTVPAQTFTGSAGTVPAQIFTGSALATHTHTLTAGGTNSTPTYVGTMFDNRPAFLRVIACRAT